MQFECTEHGHLQDKSWCYEAAASSLDVCAREALVTGRACPYELSSSFAGPVWTTLYILCGVSSWLVWTHGGFEKQRVPLTLYGINMLFNLAWNPTFFLFHAMQTAFWDALGMSSTWVLCVQIGIPLRGLPSQIACDTLVYEAI